MTIVAGCGPQSGNAASMRILAAECRQLAAGADMENVVAALSEMAADYDRQADRADKSEARTRELLAARGPIQRA